MRTRVFFLLTALFLSSCGYRIALVSPTDPARAIEPSVTVAPAATASPTATERVASPSATPRRPSSSTPSPTVPPSPSPAASLTASAAPATATPTATTTPSPTPTVGRLGAFTRTPRPSRTPIPTRTRRPSPTPTYHATLAPEVRAMRRYAMETTTVWEIIYDETIETRKLLRDVYPHLDDEEWAERLLESLTFTHLSHLMLAGMTPPPGVAEAHALILDGTIDCDKAAELILNAFSEEGEVDEIAVEAGLGLEAGCLIKVERAAQAWEEAVAIAGPGYVLKTDSKRKSPGTTY